MLSQGSALGNAEAFEIIMSVKPKTGQAIVNLGGWNPLHYACSKGHHAIVKMILYPRDSCKAYGTFNSITKRGKTPLNIAAQFGHVEAISEVGKLASRKRKRLVDRQDLKGSTALQLASTNGHIKCVDELVGFEADISIRHHSGRTAADGALGMGHVAVYEKLTKVSDTK